MTASYRAPEALADRPFTRAQAIDAGLTAKALRGRGYVRMFRSVYRCRDHEPTFRSWVRAALLVLPADSVISHVSALWWYDVRIGSMWPLHFSTNMSLVCKHGGVVLHRRRGRLRPWSRDRELVTGPERTFVDSATLLPLVLLVTAGDALIHANHTRLDALREYAETSHIHGVIRARWVLRYVSEKVESPMETLVRLMLIFARLPRPDCNPDLLRYGHFVARCDLVYHAYKVIVESDGEWHERSRTQRERDRTRREDLESLGWTVIIVLVEDLKDKRRIVHRVHDALVANGYDGPAPHFNAMWTKWFERASAS